MKLKTESKNDVGAGLVIFFMIGIVVLILGGDEYSLSENEEIKEKVEINVMHYVVSPLRGLSGEFFTDNMNFAVSIANNGEVGSLQYVYFECQIDLRNGGHVVRGFKRTLKVAVPVKKEKNMKLTIMPEYHKSEYKTSPRDIFCWMNDVELVEAQPLPAFIALHETRCDGWTIFTREGFMLIENKSDRMIKSIDLQCYREEAYGTFQDIKGLRRVGARLDELLPPNSTEWIHTGNICVENERLETSCRVGRIKYK